MRLVPAWKVHVRYRIHGITFLVVFFGMRAWLYVYIHSTHLCKDTCKITKITSLYKRAECMYTYNQADFFRIKNVYMHAHKYCRQCLRWWPLQEPTSFLVAGRARRALHSADSSPGGVGSRQLPSLTTGRARRAFHSRIEYSAGCPACDLLCAA